MFYIAERTETGLGKIIARFNDEKEAMKTYHALDIDAHAFSVDQSDWWDPKIWVAIEIWPDEDSVSERGATEEEALALYLEYYEC